MFDSVNPVYTAVSLAVMIVLIAANWKIFMKAGKPGWAILIPIYNVIVMLQIVGKPLWHVLLALLFGVVYYPYIAFSDAEYQG